MITIYTIVWNAEIILPFMIKFYRERFPNCQIIVFDNESTDATSQIAISQNCEVRPFKTNNQFDNTEMMEVRNECFKTASTDWVIVCDVDEMINITQEQLQEEEKKRFTAIQTQGWTLFNFNNDCDLSKMTRGIREKDYDKFILFNKKHISDINYLPGSHHARPRGNFIETKNIYKLLHYKWIGEDYIVDRYRQVNARRGRDEIRRGLSVHFDVSDNHLRDVFKNVKNTSVEVDPARITSGT